MTRLRGPELLGYLASLPPADRDAAVEAYLGIAGPDGSSAAPPGDELVGYQPSGVSPIVRALRDVPVVGGDVLVDLGSGLGKVVLLTRLVTDAAARGVELQPALVEKARAAARRLGIDVDFAVGDARDADLSDGTVFFLYTPCTGLSFRRVLDRLRDVAERRAIVLCALGVDVPRDVTWLVPRGGDAFWLTLYDSVLPSVPPRPRTAPALSGSAVDALALDRAHAPVTVSS